MAECDKDKICICKRPTEFQQQEGTTAATVHLVEFLSDTWLKNNHITVDIIYYLCSLLVSGVFDEFQFPNLFLSRVNPRRSKDTWHQKNQTRHFINLRLSQVEEQIMKLKF